MNNPLGAMKSGLSTAGQAVKKAAAEGYTAAKDFSEKEEN